MTILHNGNIWCASGEMNILPNMFECVNTHDSRLRVRDLVGSTNRERRGNANVDTTNVDPSAVGVYIENSDDIWSICTYPLTFGLCYAMLVRRYILLAIYLQWICTSKSSSHLKCDL